MPPPGSNRAQGNFRQHRGFHHTKLGVSVVGHGEHLVADGKTFHSRPTLQYGSSNPATHPHFDHGYAVTSHSAQGLTADRVLINADTAVHPELLNCRFAYVSVSRARLDAEIYTNDAERLGPKLATDVNKGSAIEFSQSVEIPAQKDLGMGQGI